MTDKTIKSSFKRYPDHYKFFGVEINLSQDIENTDRSTLSLLDYLGDLGGLAEFLKLFAGFFLFRLSSLRLNAIMVNRLYHFSVGGKSNKLAHRIKKKGGHKSNKLFRKTNDDLVVDVPMWLDWEQALYYICCCFRNKCNRAFKEYLEVVELGQEGFKKDMGVARFVRRIRMHGYGLHFLMGPELRANAA